MDRVAFAALATLVFLIPWDNTVVLPGIGSLAKVVGAGALGVSILCALMSGRLRTLRAVHVLALLFMMWSALSLTWTVSFDATRVMTQTYAQVVALFLLIWQHARTQSQQDALLAAYVAGASVPALDTIRHYVTGTSISTSAIRYSATGFNANELAIILVLGIPMAWYLALSIQHRRYALLSLAYVPVALVGILLSGSRGAFVALLVALLLIPWSLRRLSLHARVGFIALAFGSIAVVYATVPVDVWRRLGETADEVTGGTFSGRGELWGIALQTFLQYPLAGVGAGAFSDANVDFGAFVTTHQTFLSVLTGQGLIGFALFTSVLVCAVSSIPRMQALQRKFWTILALTLFVSLLPRDWDYRKQPWFVLGLLTAQGALARRTDSEPVAQTHAFSRSEPLVDARALPTWRVDQLRRRNIG